MVCCNYKPYSQAVTDLFTFTITCPVLCGGLTLRHRSLIASEAMTAAPAVPTRLYATAVVASLLLCGWPSLGADLGIDTALLSSPFKHLWDSWYAVPLLLGGWALVMLGTTALLGTTYRTDQGMPSRLFVCLSRAVFLLCLVWAAGCVLPSALSARLLPLLPLYAASYLDGGEHTGHRYVRGSRHETPQLHHVFGWCLFYGWCLTRRGCRPTIVALDAPPGQKTLDARPESTRGAANRRSPRRRRVTPEGDDGSSQVIVAAHTHSHGTHMCTRTHTCAHTHAHVHTHAHTCTC